MYTFCVEKATCGWTDTFCVHVEKATCDRNVYVLCRKSDLQASFLNYFLIGSFQLVLIDVSRCYRKSSFRLTQNIFLSTFTKFYVFSEYKIHALIPIFFSLFFDGYFMLIFILYIVDRQFSMIRHASKRIVQTVSDNCC